MYSVGEKGPRFYEINQIRNIYHQVKVGYQGIYIDRRVIR
jgi:hypothetical protein